MHRTQDLRELEKMQEEKIIRRKMPVRYLAVTAFCLIVSLIYGHFSHGIRSFWMSWLALWPLLFGVIPSVLMAAEIFPFREKKEEKDAEEQISGDVSEDEAGFSGISSYNQSEEVMKDIYRFGIAAVTVSSFLNGALEIAGTDSVYPGVLLYAGAVMLLCGAVGYFFARHKKRK